MPVFFAGHAKARSEAQGIGVPPQGVPKRSEGMEAIAGSTKSPVFVKRSVTKMRPKKIRRLAIQLGFSFVLSTAFHSMKLFSKCHFILPSLYK